MHRYFFPAGVKRKNDLTEMDFQLDIFEEEPFYDFLTENMLASDKSEAA